MNRASKMHKFHLNNKYIILDVNTGAVHVVDKIVYEIIDYYGEKSIDEIKNIFKSTYGEKAVEDVYNEIDELAKEGLLFSEGVDISNFKYNEENIVKAMCLHVAHDCNLKCNYCFASQGDFKGERSC